MIEFEVGYLLIFNIVPLLAILQVISLFKRIDALKQLYGARLEESPNSNPMSDSVDDQNSYDGNN